MARPGRARLARVAVVGLVVGLAPGCGSELGLPEAASDQGDEIMGLWRGSVLTAAAVAALIWALVSWSVIRYRRRSDDLPSQAPENIPIEIAYTIAPLLIVAVFFVFTVLVQERSAGADGEEDLRVDVVGFQWSWNFDYPDLGIAVNADGEEPPVLVLPVGANVRFDLRTEDVNHNFWVPEFLTKRDLIPRVDNQLFVETEREGRYTGRCAEFCGTEHWAMRFVVEIVSAEEFEAWAAERGGDAGAVADALGR